MFDSKPGMETKLTIAGLIISLFLGLIVLFMFMGKATVTPRILMYLVLMLVVFIAVVAILLYANNVEKSKRQFEDMNIYRFMDTMLDNLSPEELTFLDRLVNNEIQERELML